MKKIVIVGPESSGKTFLAEKLAAHFQCLWVPEYAREYLEKLNKPYTKEDVEKIAEGQLRLEDETAAKSKSLLICDTNLLVIKIWMDHKYGT
ncbi:MAG TPA: ATP-binding protein, partial [Chitinophagales bacterium]|nr:ATP-binding protein [Chitinophagales bacterium]